MHLLLLYTMQFPYIFDNTPDFVRGVIGIYSWQQFDSWSAVRDELWPVLIGVVALSLGFLMVKQFFYSVLVFGLLPRNSLSFLSSYVNGIGVRALTLLPKPTYGANSL